MTKADKEGRRKAPILRFKGFTDDWEQRQLKEIADIVGGGTPSTDFLEYWNGNINWFTPNEINSQIYFSESKRKISNLGLKKSSAKLLPANRSILFTSRATIGEMGILTQDATTNQGFQSLVLHNEVIPYFIFSMKSALKKQAIKKASGSTFLEISKREVEKLKIIIPSEKEQKKVSMLFKSIDNLITLYDRKLKLLSQVKKYFLDNLFAEKEYPNLRFKGFTDTWEQRKLLSNIENIIDYRGKTPKKLGLSWNGEREYPALSAINVENGRINLSKTENFGDAYLFSKWMKKSLKLGQVILTTEAPVGNVAQIKEKKHYILSQRVIAFETDKNLLDDFLYFLLQRNNSTLLRYSTGGTAKGISQKSLKQVKVNLTPNISEQKQISQLLNVVKNLIILYENKQQHLTEIKKELLNTMFI